MLSSDGQLDLSLAVALPLMALLAVAAVDLGCGAVRDWREWARKRRARRRIDE